MRNVIKAYGILESKSRHLDLESIRRTRDAAIEDFSISMGWEEDDWKLVPDHGFVCIPVEIRIGTHD